MNIDIRSTVFTVSIIAAIAGVVMIFRARKTIVEAQKLNFFTKRRKLIETGIRFIIVALLLLAFAYLNGRYGEGIMYTYFPPSLTPSLTPTITLTLPLR